MAEVDGPVSILLMMKYLRSSPLQYCDVSQQPQIEESSVLSPLLPSSSMPAETDDILYDMSPPPLIGSTVRPYFYLATGITNRVAPALPSVQLHTYAFSQQDRSDHNTQYEEELQCTNCPERCLSASCMARAEAFVATGVQ